MRHQQLFSSPSLPRLSTQKSPTSFSVKLNNIPKYIRPNQATLPSLIAAWNSLDTLKDSRIKYETLFQYQLDPNKQVKQFILNKNSDFKVKLLQGILDKYMKSRMMFYTPEPDYLTKDYIKQRPYDVSVLEKIETGRKIVEHCEKKFGRQRTVISRNSLRLEDVMLSRLERISAQERTWSLTKDQLQQLQF